MRDRLWQAVHDALCPLVQASDVVLAPRGDWLAFPCLCLHYEDVIDIGDVTVFVLHKGRMAGIRKEDLRRIAREWQWTFANEVFVVFSRSRKIRRDVRLGLGLIHCWPVMRFLRSASLRKRRGRIVYVHVPKTGGTSMWASLARAFPSHVYYAKRACLSEEPAGRRGL
jgi:hypothetical protein